MRITAKAPTRITLFCIGQDVEPFCSEHGAKVLNFAINLRHTCTLIPRNDDWVWIEAMGESRIHKLKDLPKKGIDPKYDLIYETIRSYAPQTGFQLIDKFDGIQGAGLGSSASACVSMMGAFNKWKGISLRKIDIAEFAQRLELELGWISGWQDQIASVFGGVNFIESKGFPSEVAHMVHIKEYFENLVKGMKKEERIEALKKGNELIAEGIGALMSSDIERFGKLIDKTWELKKIANPFATNFRINLLYQAALNAGAYGGKVLGAGSEGHIFFVCEPKKQKKVIKALEDLGVKQIDFGIDWNGLEVRQI